MSQGFSFPVEAIATAEKRRTNRRKGDKRAEGGFQLRTGPERREGREAGETLGVSLSVLGLNIYEPWECL